MSNKVCPVSKAQFIATATPAVVDIAGQKLTAMPREFNTGSLGWYLSGKVTIMVDGKPCQVQVGANMILVGSKG